MSKINPEVSAVESIVRAYGDEPLRRIILRASQGCFEVAVPGADHGAMFPTGEVFAWSASLFKRLRADFEMGRSADLAEHWKAAERLPNRMGSA